MKQIKCPEECTGAGPEVLLYLAGGVANTLPWQRHLSLLLRESKLTLLNPRRDYYCPAMHREQIEWETRHMCRADAILFWFGEETMCPVSLFELGFWLFRPKKLFIGVHPNYVRRFDLEVRVALERPRQTICPSVERLADLVLEWGRKMDQNRFNRDEEQPPGRKG